MKPIDQAERDRARFAVGANTVVEAGAGTGKTTLLAERLVSAVLAGGPERAGLAIERIAALTFTEKAAGELKDRVAGHLEDLLAALAGGGAAAALPPRRRARAEEWLGEVESRFARGPGEVKKAAGAALSSLDRAMIGTLHQFAGRLLRLHPVAAGVDPAFVIDEGDRSEALFESEWARWLDLELGEAAPRRAEWLEVLAAARLEDLRVLAQALAEPKVDLDRLHAGADGLARAARLRRQVLAIPEGQPKTTARKIYERVEAVAAALGRFEAPPPASVPARLLPPEFPKAEWPKKWEPYGEDALDTAERVAQASPESDLLLVRAAALLRPFVIGYRRACARRGWLGFEGLLVSARNLVRDDLTARRALQREFQALLVDEFQDTDPLQGETVLFLGAKEGGAARDWRELDFEPGRLFVVGDPKQSIYQFRGADIRAYEDFAGLLLKRGAERCVLSVNFRSAPAVLGPVNDAFGRLMGYEQGMQPAYQPLTAADPDKTGAVDIRLCVSRDGSPLKSDAAIEGQAAMAARWVAENCGPEGSGRPHRFKDVAVLSRGAAPLRAFVEAFKAAGLPHVVEAERFFYETQEVSDFLNVLRVLDDPSDRLSLAGLLRSPLAAIEDRELAALASDLDYRRDPPAGRLSPAAAARVGQLYAALRGLSGLVGRLPLESVVGAVLERTPLLELGAAAYHSDQTVANLFKFARMAAACGEAEGHTLKEYIATVERERERGRGREGESPLADDRFDAVRLLTMHKAKGLEWPVVILPNLDSPPSKGGRDPEAVVWDPAENRAGLCLPKDGLEDLGYSLLDGDRVRREERERVRLLYVAMTRAKTRLLLLGAAAPAASSRTSFAGMLAHAGLWPTKEAAVSDPARLFFADEPPPSPAAAAKPAPAADWPALGGAWKRREDQRSIAELRRVFVSPALESGGEKRAPQPASDESAERRRLTGTACHLVLERWDYKNGGDLGAALAAAARVLTASAPAEQWKPAVTEAAVILEEFLASAAALELARAEILGRELPVVYERDGSVVRGSIDLLYRLDGKLVVADYKTERVSGEGLEAAAGRYAAQMELYVEGIFKALGERPQARLIFLRAPLALSAVEGVRKLS